MLSQRPVRPAVSLQLCSILAKKMTITEPSKTKSNLPKSKSTWCSKKQCVLALSFYGCVLKTSPAWLCPGCEVCTLQGPEKGQAAATVTQLAGSSPVGDRGAISPTPPKKGGVDLFLAPMDCKSPALGSECEPFRFSSTFALKMRLGAFYLSAKFACKPGS